MFIRNERDGRVWYTSEALSSHGFAHLFASRFGGVSTGAFASLNVSTNRKDEHGNPDNPENVAENYRLALSCIGATPQNSAAARQVHGTDILRIGASDGGRGILPEMPVLPDADGILLAADTENVGTVCVKTADCVPILLANLVTGDVCAVHAGWRGTAAGIVCRAAESLAGAGAVGNVAAAIGPCIGACCYEVGEEVAQALRERLAARDITDDAALVTECGAGKYMADLAGVNRTLLLSMGVKAENIDVSGLCTCCLKEASGKRVFFSHRGQGGHSGTFVSAISARKMSKKTAEIGADF